MKCSDTIMTKTVMEMSRDEVGSQIFNTYVASDSRDIPLLVSSKSKSYSEILAIATDKHSETYTAATEVTDKVLANFRLEDIWLQGRDDTSQKLACVANLVSEGKAEIEYTAQLTETGDVYVEVFGLDQ